MSDHVRVGVIGLGMGRHHLRLFCNNPNCHITAIAELNEEKLHNTAQEFDVPHTYTDGEALINSGKVDAVAIATPNFTHHPLAMAAIDKKIHVLCEKPLALNAEQGQTMIEAAEAAGIKFAMHFNHRMAPSTQVMANYARNGDLGEIYFARTIWHRRRGIPRGASGWFYNKQQSGGGAMIDLGVHMIDQALYLMGYPKVVGVCGQAVTKFAEEDLPNTEMDVDDFATAYVRCDNDATLAVEISWAGHHELREQMLLAVYGTRGGAVRRGGDVEIFRREHGQLTNTQVDSHGLSFPSVQDDFIDAIRHDRQPNCSGEHGLTVMRILDGIYRSSQTGHEIRFD